MVNISIDVTDLGGEARPGDKVVLWKPAAAGSSSHAGRVISTAPVDVFLTNGKASVPDVEPGDMRVLLQCRGVESQGPIDVTVPDGNGTVTLRSLIESQFEYAPPIVSAVQEAAANASASERAAIEAQVRSEAAADRADAKVDDAINNGADLIRNEVKQDADRAVSARQAATQSESNAAASEGAAASSASNAAASESAAKQSETNAGEFAAVATTAATEAVDAMEVASASVSSIGDSVSRAAASADSASQSEINAAQYESSAATHAQNATEAATKVGTAAELDGWARAAQEAADRVGTAEQVGVWASESSAAASRAAQSETNAKASEEAAATSESNAAASESAVSGAISRVDALEAMAGLAPESPVDGQTANLVSQGSTLTRAALSENFRERSHHLVEVSPEDGLSQKISEIPANGVILLMPDDQGNKNFALSSYTVLDKPVVIEGGVEGIEIDVSLRTFEAQTDNVIFRNLIFKGTGTSHLLSTSLGENHNGWRFENCRFVGVSLRLTKRGRKQLDGSTVDLGTGVSENPQVIGCEFTEYRQSYTIEVAGCNNAIIERTWIHDVGLDSSYGDGIKILAGSVGTRVAFCTIEDTTRDSIDIYDSSENVIIGNVLRRGLLGIDNKWRTTDYNPRKFDMITNNICEDASNTAFNINVHHAIVIGNSAFRAGTRGFYCGTSVDASGVSAPSLHSIFIGNQALECGDSGFSIGGAGVALIGNVSTSNANYGFTGNPGAAQITMQGNTSTDNGVSNLNINGPTVSLAGNLTSDPTSGWLRLPNDARITSLDAAGTIRSIARISPSNTLAIGDTGTNLTQLQAGAAVEVVPEMRMRAGLRHYGDTAGFFGKAPVPRPTGVAATPEAIHAALVALGLIT